MKKTKILASLLVLTMMASLMTACGKNAEESAGVVTENEITEVETEALESASVETETADPETTETDSAMETETLQETKAIEEEAEVVPGKTEKTEETPAVEAKTEESAPAAENLPGENRNGRYADIPESVMPSDSNDWYFWDDPLPLYTWTDGTVANVYADYNKTQVIASFSYPENEDTGMYLIAVQGDTGRGIAIYNNQYAIVAYDMMSTSSDPNDR